MPTATAARPASSMQPACLPPPSLPNQRLRIKPSRHTRNKRAAIVGSRPFSYHQSTGLGLWQDKVGFQTGIGSMQKIQHLYFLIFHLQRQPNLPGGVRRKADRASILQLDPISQIRNIADVVGVVLLLAVGRNQLYFYRRIKNSFEQIFPARQFVVEIRQSAVGKHGFTQSRFTSVT